MGEKEYSVSEAVRLIGVESHVLRYWEEELQIEIHRNHQGHRVYTDENVDMFCYAKELKEKGLQLKAIRLLLDEQEKHGRQTNTEEKEFVRHLKEIAASPTKEQTVKEVVINPTEEQEECVEYELVVNERQDNVRQFELILRKLMEEVVSEQNLKLQETIIRSMREEMEDFYLQYYQMMQEVAASAEMPGRNPGKIIDMLKSFLFRKGRRPGE